MREGSLVRLCGSPATCYNSNRFISLPYATLLERHKNILICNQDHGPDYKCTCMSLQLSPQRTLQKVVLCIIQISLVCLT